MKIIFISNFYNHHQSGISRKLYELTSGQYRFVATEEIPEERKKMGYSGIDDEFVVQYGVDPVQDCQISRWIDEAEAIIIGSAPEHLIQNRKKQRKLILRYSERPLKNGFQFWKYPLRWVRWHYLNPPGAPIYMLCASAYTALDYRKFGLFRNKALKWGYFPICKKYEHPEHMIAQKNVEEILWCGRFLDWKHPDDALSLADRLKKEKYHFHLTMIGTGEMEEQLKDLVSEYGLGEFVTFAGAMSPEQVRLSMERAGVYLMTSDRKEGWGAVLNEAMNSGCAVVASREAGSTPYLVQDGINGSVYTPCRMDELYEKVRFLLEHPDEQKRRGKAAYHTIVETWNEEIAALRILNLIDLINNGEVGDIFRDGPCSRA